MNLLENELTTKKRGRPRGSKNKLKGNLVDREKEINKSQKGFLTNLLEKAANTAIDFGIRIVTPDIIENQVIDIKNSIFENGLTKGIDNIVKNIQDFGKNILGLNNGNYNDFDEINLAIKKMEMDSILSSNIEKGVEKYLDKNIDKLEERFKEKLKSNDKNILDKFNKSIEKNLNEEMSKVQKLNEFNNLWEKAWDDRDIDKMEKYLKEINKLRLEIPMFKNLISKSDLINELHGNIVRTGRFDYVEGMDQYLIEQGEIDKDTLKYKGKLDY